MKITNSTFFLHYNPWLNFFTDVSWRKSHFGLPAKLRVRVHRGRRHHPPQRHPPVRRRTDRNRVIWLAGSFERFHWLTFRLHLYCKFNSFCIISHIVVFWTESVNKLVYSIIFVLCLYWKITTGYRWVMFWNIKCFSVISITIKFLHQFKNWPDASMLSPKNLECEKFWKRHGIFNMLSIKTLIFVNIKFLILNTFSSNIS